jgi:class 3 adenylate cyclase
MFAAKSLILKTFTAFVTVASRFMLCCLLFVLAGQGLAALDHIDKFPLLKNALSLERIFEKPFTTLLHANVPCVSGGLDLAPYIVAGALLILWIVFETERYRLRGMAWKLEQERNNAKARKELARVEAKSAKASKALLKEQEAARKQADADARVRLRAEAEAQQALARESAQKAALAASAAAAPAPIPAVPRAEHDPEKGTEREQLLELYAQTKKSLEEQKKNLSFLAVDVVNSTGMKQGEDSALAERDFRQYRKLVERVIAAHKGLKAAWTPDGTMICFASVQNAVQAAQDLIRGLEHFNRSVKTIKADFQVRCGINAGKVMFDDSVRMEEMTDRHIDIAGHMQKYAEANTIYVGAHAIEGMRSQFGFRPLKKQVDGCDVYEWREGSADLDIAPASV